ncbi:gas1-like protein [Lentinula edodes]|uniref:Gas1-like protein n=1 Tax=Lentinula edodes TaxID=5353 RepID=A0A1Q3ENA0_LENED|nr:gas1-like protein [Lentinula edodes]
MFSKVFASLSVLLAISVQVNAHAAIAPALGVDGTPVRAPTAVTVSQNGDAAPTTVGSDQIVAALPAGTTCSGGTAGNLCLVQFTTTAGFGNCVVVAQGAATGGERYHSSNYHYYKASSPQGCCCPG